MLINLFDGYRGIFLMLIIFLMGHPSAHSFRVWKPHVRAHEAQNNPRHVLVKIGGK